MYRTTATRIADAVLPLCNPNAHASIIARAEAALNAGGCNAALIAEAIGGLAPPQAAVRVLEAVTAVLATKDRHDTSRGDLQARVADRNLPRSKRRR